MNETTLVLTPSALLTFLSEIEELKGLDLELSQQSDNLQIKIGESIYTLQSPSDSIVEIDDSAVAEINEIDEEGYDEISSNDDTILEEIEGEVVEGGIIKELIKTLAIGGLVRLTKDALTK